MTNSSSSSAGPQPETSPKAFRLLATPDRVRSRRPLSDVVIKETPEKENVVPETPESEQGSEGRRSGRSRKRVASYREDSDSDVEVFEEDMDLQVSRSKRKKAPSILDFVDRGSTSSSSPSTSPKKSLDDIFDDDAPSKSKGDTVVVPDTPMEDVRKSRQSRVSRKNFGIAKETPHNTESKRKANVLEGFVQVLDFVEHEETAPPKRSRRPVQKRENRRSGRQSSRAVTYVESSSSSVTGESEDDAPVVVESESSNEDGDEAFSSESDAPKKRMKSSKNAPPARRSGRNSGKADMTAFFADSSEEDEPTTAKRSQVSRKKTASKPSARRSERAPSNRTASNDLADVFDDFMHSETAASRRRRRGKTSFKSILDDESEGDENTEKEAVNISDEDGEEEGDSEHSEIEVGSSSVGSVSESEVDEEEDTDDKEDISKILAVRLKQGSSLSPHAENVVPEDMDDYEYLVLLKNHSYRDVQWIGREKALGLFEEEYYDYGGKKRPTDDDIPEIKTRIRPNTHDLQRVRRFWRQDPYVYTYENCKSCYVNSDGEPLFPLEFCRIDRIIAASGDGDDPEKTQYLVKWRQQTYAESTWEFGSDLRNWEMDSESPVFDDMEDSDMYEALRMDFVNREEWPSLEDLQAPRRPRSLRKLTESPAFHGGRSLRAYQLEGLNWLLYNWHQRRNCILADEMGLGKTVQSVSLLHQLFSAHQFRGPFMVLAPLSTIGHWANEFRRFTPEMNCVVYHGDADSRQIIQDNEFNFNGFEQNKRVRENPVYYRKLKKATKFHVLLTTYELALKDVASLSKISWQVLVVDEGHRLKNRDAKLSTALKQYRFDYKALLTGTPIQNNLMEVWTLMNFLEPDKDPFDAWESFEERFGDLKENPDRVKELQELLRPYMLRRLKEHVEKSIPPKEETLVQVGMSTEQKTYYRAVLEKRRDVLAASGGGRSTPKPSLINILMELRKVCNHPVLIEKTPLHDAYYVDHTMSMEEVIRMSGKFMFLDKLLRQLKENGSRVLIFSQMTRVLDLLADLLHHRGYEFQRLDGNIRGIDRQRAIDEYNKPGSTNFAFLLSTRAGGLGVNLTSADTVVLFDSDFNPQNDLQAQARCHRIGQKKNLVRIYRLICQHTHEWQWFQIAAMKQGLSEAVLGSVTAKYEVDDEELQKMLKYGAYYMFENADEGTGMEEKSIEDILRENSTVHRYTSADGTNADKGTDTFAKATFVANEDGVDVDDPDFWTKVLPQEHNAAHLLTIIRETAEDLESDADKLREVMTATERVVNNTREALTSGERGTDRYDTVLELLEEICASNFPEGTKAKATEWANLLQNRGVRNRTNNSKRGSYREDKLAMRFDSDEDHSSDYSESDSDSAEKGPRAVQSDGFEWLNSKKYRSAVCNTLFNNHYVFVRDMLSSLRQELKEAVGASSDRQLVGYAQLVMELAYMECPDVASYLVPYMYTLWTQDVLEKESTRNALTWGIRSSSLPLTSNPSPGASLAFLSPSTGSATSFEAFENVNIVLEGLSVAPSDGFMVFYRHTSMKETNGEKAPLFDKAVLLGMSNSKDASVEPDSDGELVVPIAVHPVDSLHFTVKRDALWATVQLPAIPGRYTAAVYTGSRDAPDTASSLPVFYPVQTAAPERLEHGWLCSTGSVISVSLSAAVLSSPMSAYLKSSMKSALAQLMDLNTGRAGLKSLVGCLQSGKPVSGTMFTGAPVDCEDDMHFADWELDTRAVPPLKAPSSNLPAWWEPSVHDWRLFCLYLQRGASSFEENVLRPYLEKPGTQGNSPGDEEAGSGPEDNTPRASSFTVGEWPKDVVLRRRLRSYLTHMKKSLEKYAKKRAKEEQAKEAAAAAMAKLRAKAEAGGPVGSLVTAIRSKSAQIDHALETIEKFEKVSKKSRQRQWKRFREAAIKLVTRFGIPRAPHGWKAEDADPIDDQSGENSRGKRTDLYTYDQIFDQSTIDVSLAAFATSGTVSPSRALLYLVWHRAVLRLVRWAEQKLSCRFLYPVHREAVTEPAQWCQTVKLLDEQDESDGSVADGPGVEMLELERFSNSTDDSNGSSDNPPKATVNALEIGFRGLNKATLMALESSIIRGYRLALFTGESEEKNQEWLRGYGTRKGCIRAMQRDHLPPCWKTDVHTLALLQAIAKEGLVWSTVLGSMLKTLESWNRDGKRGSIDRCVEWICASRSASPELEGAKSEPDQSDVEITTPSTAASTSAKNAESSDARPVLLSVTLSTGVVAGMVDPEVCASLTSHVDDVLDKFYSEIETHRAYNLLRFLPTKAKPSVESTTSSHSTTENASSPAHLAGSDNDMSSLSQSSVDVFAGAKSESPRSPMRPGKVYRAPPPSSPSPTRRVYSPSHAKSPASTGSSSMQHPAAVEHTGSGSSKRSSPDDLQGADVKKRKKQPSILSMFKRVARM